MARQQSNSRVHWQQAMQRCSAAVPKGCDVNPRFMTLQLKALNQVHGGILGLPHRQAIMYKSSKPTWTTR
jgi:hypothetical protein